MKLVQPESWRPRGIDDLEPSAWRALRHCGSTCVVAGPGAGKTEFLAQRAAYLLETGLCPAPFKILAISFKSDAAANLSERVRKRCPPELSNRFISLTFDSFTKGLVDRFQMALPEDWRPTRPYSISFPTLRETSGFLQDVIHLAPKEWSSTIAGIGARNFESQYIGSYRLPLSQQPPQSGVEFAISHWWRSQLTAQPRSSLTFVGINRLAELLLRTSPHIRKALQITYPFIFVDEFQDTTYSQYDFLLSAFHNTSVAITAVGDNKQRIMAWAGARIDAFERFSSDFSATEIPLLFNFRSSPDLVRVQHVVARALDPGAATTVARTVRQVNGDVAQVWYSRTVNREAAYLADWLINDMTERNRAPRDYAILVKQRSDEFENDLSGALKKKGLRLRNESHKLGQTTLQDLLSDTFAKVVLALLRLGSTRRAATSWRLISAVILDVRSVSPGDTIGEAKIESELTEFIKVLRVDMRAMTPSEASANVLADRAIAFLGLSQIARTYVEYSTGDRLAIMADAFKRHLIASSTDAITWDAALDIFEGVDQIPLMTVHKSKGLEYDTIVFVGLDDRAWWAHHPGNLEGLATFFVALSRAKQRAIFAFCQERGQRKLVAELFQLLTNAGVPEIRL